MILPHEKNPALREIAREIPLGEIRSERIRGIISDMKDLLAKEEFGVALAASQLGERLRLFIVSGRGLARGSRSAPDEPKRDEMTSHRIESEALPDQVYINPVLTKLSKRRSEKHEGCLSIRGFWGEVPRAEKATIRAYDEEGRQFMRGASGFLAHIFQHEMDHLDGILYTDKATHIYEEKNEEK